MANGGNRPLDPGLPWSGSAGSSGGRSSDRHLPVGRVHAGRSIRCRQRIANDQAEAVNMCKIGLGPDVLLGHRRLHRPPLLSARCWWTGLGASAFFACLSAPCMAPFVVYTHCPHHPRRNPMTRNRGPVLRNCCDTSPIFLPRHGGGSRSNRPGKRCGRISRGAPPKAERKRIDRRGKTQNEKNSGKGQTWTLMLQRLGRFAASAPSLANPLRLCHPLTPVP